MKNRSALSFVFMSSHFTMLLSKKKKNILYRKEEWYMYTSYEHTATFPNTKCVMLCIKGMCL